MKGCTFIGHRDCSCDIKEELSLIIEHLIVHHNVRVFYVGTHGGFDKLVYSTLCELENKYDIKIIVVLAYLNAKEDKMYDIEKTVYPQELSTTLRRYAIIKRNEYMIKHSEYLVSYVNNRFSNAYKFIELATRRGVNIINIGSVMV